MSCDGTWHGFGSAYMGYGLVFLESLLVEFPIDKHLMERDELRLDGLWYMSMNEYLP